MIQQTGFVVTRDALLLNQAVLQPRTKFFPETVESHLTGSLKDEIVKEQQFKHNLSKSKSRLSLHKVKNLEGKKMESLTHNIISALG